MNDNTQPLTANEIAAITARAEQYLSVDREMDAIHDREFELSFKNIPLSAEDEQRLDGLRERYADLRSELGYDAIKLLAHVAVLTARAEAAEAALRVYELERDAYVSTQTVFDTVWDAIRIMRGEITGNYYMMGGSDAMLTAIEQAREEVRRLRAQQAADALANGDADAGNGGG